MKKNIIKSIVSIVLAFAISLTLIGCTGGSDDCYICGGSGYYQKKDCPGC